MRDFIGPMPANNSQRPGPNENYERAISQFVYGNDATSFVLSHSNSYEMKWCFDPFGTKLRYYPLINVTARSIPSSIRFYVVGFMRFGDIGAFLGSDGPSADVFSNLFWLINGRTNYNSSDAFPLNMRIDMIFNNNQELFKRTVNRSLSSCY